MGVWDQSLSLSLSLPTLDQEFGEIICVYCVYQPKTSRTEYIHAAFAQWSPTLYSILE